jgi:hypothetical protein
MHIFENISRKQSFFRVLTISLFISYGIIRIKIDWMHNQKNFESALSTSLKEFFYIEYWKSMKCNKIADEKTFIQYELDI